MAQMFSGAFGRVTDMRKKLHKEKAGLMKNNPAAFQEDVAAQAEAEFRCGVIGGGRVRSIGLTRCNMHDWRSCV